MYEVWQWNTLTDSVTNFSESAVALSFCTSIPMLLAVPSSLKSSGVHSWTPSSTWTKIMHQNVVRLEELLHAFLTSAPDEGRWPVAHAGHFVLWNMSSVYIGGGVGWASELIFMLKRRRGLSPCRESKPSSPVVQPAVRSVHWWAIPVTYSC
jgi:hypothetical protein